MFYPQQGYQIPQQQQQPSRMMGAPQPQQPYQKREKKMLRITDPNTGRDITDDIIFANQTGGSKTNTPPQSGPSSARATPVGASVSGQFSPYEQSPDGVSCHLYFILHGL